MQDRKLPRRQHTTEFKVEATRLAESVGGHEVARRLGVPVATLGNWNVGADSNLSQHLEMRRSEKVDRTNGETENALSSPNPALSRSC